MFSSYYPSWYAVFQGAFVAMMTVREMNGGALTPLDALIAAAIAFTLWLAVFILQGMGLYKMSKRAQHSKPWLAFIPFAHVFLLGKLTGEVNFFGHKIRRLGLYVMFVEIAAAIYYVFIAIAMYVLFVQNGSLMEVYNGMYIKWNDLPTWAKGWETFYQLSGNIVGVLSLVHAILLLMLYMSFYKRYSYRSYFILAFGGILIPFFNGITVFVLRNKEPIDYDALLRARQAAFRAQQQSNPWQGGYGYGGSYGNPYGNPYGGQRPSDPESQAKKPEDPFGEFSNGSGNGSSGGSTSNGGDDFFS